MLANPELCLLERDPTIGTKVFENPSAIDARKLRDGYRKARRILKPSLAERHRLLKNSSASHEVAWQRNQGIPLWSRPRERSFIHQPKRSKALVLCSIDEVTRMITSFKVING